MKFFCLFYKYLFNVHIRLKYKQVTWYKYHFLIINMPFFINTQIKCAYQTYTFYLIHIIILYVLRESLEIHKYAYFRNIQI